MPEKGKIVFLNGVTSSGKTSIAKAFQELADENFYHVSNDMSHHMLGRKFTVRSMEESKKYIVQSVVTMYYAIKGMLENDINIIIDGLLLEWNEFIEGYGKTNYDIFKSVLDGYDVFMVEVYCPLEECRKRNLEREGRGEYQSEEQSKEMNQRVVYDCFVDTSECSSKECAVKILEELYGS